MQNSRAVGTDASVSTGHPSTVYNLLNITLAAAPGKKSAHSAAFTGVQGRVLAFDSSPRRAQVMHQLMKQLGADSIVTTHASDFRSVEPGGASVSDTRYILLDPSCSGKSARINTIVSFHLVSLYC